MSLGLAAMNKGIRVSARQPFNCGDQGNPTWRERADLCADLVGSLACASGGQFTLADIGCGDQKLKVAFRARGLKCRYQGYDLLPQHGNVTRFDVCIDRLPHAYDVAVVLGVLEYLETVDDVVAGLAKQATWLVMSYVIRQDGRYTDERLAELGWRNHFSESEVVALVERNGLSVVRRCMTSDGRTLLMGCRSQPLQTPAAVHD